MKLSKPVKIFIGIITFWSAIYPLLFLVLLEMETGFLSLFFFEDPSSTFTLFSAIFPIHCLTMIFYLGLIIFYIVHVIKNSRASEVVRIVLLIGVFLMPFIVMPIYYILYIWLDNPPAWAMTNENGIQSKEPLWQQKQVWILRVGILVAMIICNLKLPSIMNYGRSIVTQNQPRGEVLQEFKMEEVESKEVEPDQNEYISALAISPDGKVVATGTLKGFIYLWRVSDGSVINTSQAHDGAVWGLVFVSNGEVLVSSSSDKSIKLWQVLDWSLSHTYRTRCEAFGLAITPDGSKLASSFDCLSGEGVKIWDFRDGALLQTLGGQSDGAHSVAFSPDGQLLAVGGWQQLQIWRLSDGLLLHSMNEIEEGGDLTVTFSPDGKTLISSGERYAIRMWDPVDGTLKRKIKIEFSGSNPVFFPHGESFIVGLWDGKIKQWDVSNGRTIETWNRPSIGVEYLALSANGTVLVSSDARLTRVWAVEP